MRFLPLLLLGLAAFQHAVHALCPKGGDYVSNGTCMQNYTGVCAPYVGSSIFMAPGMDITVMEEYVLSAIKTIRKNSAIATASCVHDTDWYACAGSIYPCIEAGGGEGIPQLPCDSDCADYYASCQSTLNQYYSQVLLINNEVEVSVVPQCINGTFTGASLPIDRFGHRNFSTLPYPYGYVGQILYPVNTANYTLANNTQVEVQCFHPQRVNATTVVNVGVPNCGHPLVLGTDGGGNPVCLVPCPFPVFEEADRSQIQLAFVIPAFFGLACCVFVLLDSLWVIFETTNGFALGAFARKYLGATSGGTATVTSGAGTAQTSGTGVRNRQVRATTLYSLAGSSLGILYFMLGPLPTLIKRSDVSCGGVYEFSFQDILDGTVDYTDDSCRAQRVAPFVLQLCFNLVLYAMIKVLTVVSERFKKLEDRGKLIFDTFWVLYCAGVPLLCLIIALADDHMPAELTSAATVLIRQAIICTPRFSSPSTEFVLIYLPFIVTGVIITFLSVYIFIHLMRIREKVAGIGMKNKTASDTALQLLILRLALLGLCTFVVLIILMVTTSLSTNATTAFTPLWVDWFGCSQATFSCDADLCAAKLALATANRPTVPLLAVQLAAMSTITALFGLFFALQSLSRLYKEYMDGSLGRKLRNLRQGRHAQTATGTGMSGDNRSQQPPASMAVAAYQMDDDVKG